MDSLGSVKSISWEDESYPAYRDFAVLPLFSLFFLVVRVFLHRFVFEKIAEHNGVKGAKRKRKFKEQAWTCLYYISTEALAMYVAYNEPWFTKRETFWVGPGNRTWPDQQMKLKLKGYYMYQAGFYAFSILALVFWDTRRSDFAILMCHHFAALILIAMSYILRCARVGTVVLVLHDLSDIFLAVGKMCGYTGREKLGSYVFVVFFASWILTRLIYFPFWVLRSTLYEVVHLLDKEISTTAVRIYYFVFNTLLVVLLFMHIYWTVLILGMAAKIQKHGQISKDDRSDSEDEHED